MRRFFLAAAAVVALGSASVQAQPPGGPRVVTQQQYVAPVRLGVSAFSTGNAMEISTVQPVLQPLDWDWKLVTEFWRSMVVKFDRWVSCKLA